jgi:HAD superfamily phosphoserine phosphatase-like hydrolase
MIKALFVDFGGTLVTGSGINSVPEYLGRGDISNNLRQKFRSGEISKEEFLDKTFEGWKGFRVSDLSKIYSSFKFVEGSKETINKINERGIKIILLSKLPLHIGRLLQDDLKLYHITGTELEVVAGVFTGKVLKYPQKKADSVSAILKNENISPDEAISIGDKHDDAKVFEKVKFGVAYKGDDIANRASKYQIDNFKELLNIIEKEQ